MKEPLEKKDDNVWVFKNNPTPILLAMAGLGLSLTVWSFSDVAGHATRMAAVQDAALLAQSVASLQDIYTQRPSQPSTEMPSRELEDPHGGANPHTGAKSLVRKFADAIGQTDLSPSIEIYGPQSLAGGSNGGQLPDDFARRAWTHLNKNPDEPFFEHSSREGEGLLRYAMASRISDGCFDCHESNPAAPGIEFEQGELQSVIDVTIPLSAALVVDPSVDIQQGFTLFAFLGLLWFSVAAVAMIAERKKTQAAEASALQHQQMSEKLTNAIAELENAQSEREQLAAQIQHAQKIESLGQMTGSLAHDFNNLLVPILANANFLKSELPPTSPGQEMIEDIDSAAERGSNLCRQMLAYAGQANIERQYSDLNRVLSEMTELLRLNASRTCKLELDLSKDSLYFEFDPVQIEQILLNLTSNASDAIGDKTGTITIRTGTCPIDSPLSVSSPFQRPTKVQKGAPNEYRIPRATTPGVFIEVTDDGEGVAEEDIGKIFDPFYSSKAPGRGLGLAAVDGIVRSHGGTIAIESELGKFTRFRVSFPAESESPSDRSRNYAHRLDNQLQTGTVLVADDEPAVRSVAARMLESFGFKVVTAENGESATRIFEESPDSFCACLFDVTMPVKDGLRALHEIRNLRPSQPAVLFSGFSEKFAEIRELESRHTTFLEKPFQSDALRAKIVGVLPHPGETPQDDPEAQGAAAPPLPTQARQVAQMVQRSTKSGPHETT